ncbi:hypothetical protein [Arsukibacterium sp.]|uniref:hypothetical protein n=1 Tax=Arsukibacterium sp. TaxID=1977258 RepID=UPI002FDABB29
MKMPTIKPRNDIRRKKGAGLFQAAAEGNLWLWNVLEDRLAEVYKNANKSKN